MHIKVLTANRLSDGAVVYLHEGGEWSPDLAGAMVVTDAEQEARELRAAGDADRLIIGAYPMVIEQNTNAVQPTSQREHIRHHGPTVWFGDPASPRAEGSN